MSNYHKELDKKNILKLRRLIKELPPFVFQFFRGIETTTSTRTRIAYAYDLLVFFNFALENIDLFKEKLMADIAIEDLDNISLNDFEYYVDYLTYYETFDKDSNLVVHTNSQRGKARKIASLRTFYKYFYKKQLIKNNIPSLIDMPKLNNQKITRLEANEVANLLDEIETGKNLTKGQKKYHNLTKERDLALVTLLLGTGIRVSECVGINISDIDFDINGVKITRKGGDEVIIYFGDEVARALLDYLPIRNKIIPQTGHENALFLSMQNRRLSVRSVQNIVKKYSKLTSNLKNISPHKLRSTYGTSLYRATGDIYLVADVLGHKDVNTTRKHYAEIEDSRRRQAARVVKLRDD